LEEGIRDALGSGPLLGYPVVDVKVDLVSGGYQDNVSTELAYRVASAMAFRKSCEQASPMLLEPYMAVEVLVPEEYLGEVLGDINLRKGRIESIAARKAIQVVKGVVPLSKMFGYSTALRSSTQGRATYTMQFSHYDTASET
jgi:elongation factor G